MQTVHRELYRAIGVRIRKARKKKPRLTQGMLATQLGLSRVSVVNIEAGRQAPPLHVLLDIARVLGVELSELVPPTRSRGELDRLPPEERALAQRLLEDDSLSSKETTV